MGSARISGPDRAPPGIGRRRARRECTTSEGAAPASRKALATGIVCWLANPAGLAFWTGLDGGMLGASGDPTRTDVVVMLSGFIAGAAVWGAGMALALTWSRRFAHGKAFRVVDAVCGLTLSYFGIRLLWMRMGRWLAPIARLAS